MFVFGLLAITVAAFASDRLRLDLIAILVVLALILSEVLTPREALAGFGDTVVLLIAGLFIVGEGLAQTGVAAAIGNWLTRAAGTSETRMLVLLMLVVAGLSAFMSSTGAVAIFIPVVLGLAVRTGSAPGRLLMPLSIASLVGGMLTLIGTPPNLIVSEQLERSDLQPFGFFDFAPIGLLVLAVTILYVVMVGRRLLPGGAPNGAAPVRGQTTRELAQAYGVAGQLHLVQVERGSSLAGKTIIETRMRSRYGVTAMGIERHGRFASAIMPALVDSAVMAGDRLYVVATDDCVAKLVEAEGVVPVDLPPDFDRNLAERIGLVEVLLTPGSHLIDRTLAESEFRERHRLSVLAAQRKRAPLPIVPAKTRFRFGDSLLIFGSRDDIERLQEDRSDVVVLGTPADQAELPPAGSRAPVAVMIVLAMLTVMTLNLVAGVTAVLAAAVAMLVTGCVRARDVYRTINWQSLVLIAGMLPMATAMEKTGGIALVVDGLVTALGPMGPIALMAGLFVLTSVFSQFISNTATTVLLAPVAIAAAGELGVSPYPILMTVAIAASTAFSTPVASPVNTLVLGPGNYRFMDFVKVGVPLQLLVLIVTLLSVPLVFPL